MKVSLNLCLLFSLISPVLLLSCKICLSGNSTSCPKEFSDKCNPGFSCRSSIFSSDVFDNSKMALKTCIPSASCNPGYYSVTTSGGRSLKMLVDCCTTNNCNKKRLEFSSQPMEPNGLECEGCHVEGQSTCEGTEMVKCLGDQTKCISMSITYVATGTMHATIVTTKGCATPLICSRSKVNKNTDFNLMGVKIIIANCTDAMEFPTPTPSSLP